MIVVSRLAVVAAVVVVIASGCSLRPYADGAVSCSRDGENPTPCPDGYACLPSATDKRVNVCRVAGCGDGQLDPTTEECDDGDDNDFDACVDCIVRRWTVGADGFGPGNGKPDQTPIGRPSVVASDPDGNVFIGSIGTNTITRLDKVGERISVFAGNGALVALESNIAVPPNEVATVFAASLAVDGVGDVYFSDLQNSVIRRIDAVTGDTTVVVGTGIQGVGLDNVPGTQSQLNLAVGLALDGDGNLFIAEKIPGGGDQRLNRIRRLDRRTNIITTVINKKDGTQPATDSELEGPPDDIAFDAQGRLYVFTNAFDRVRDPRQPAEPAVEFSVDVTIAYGVAVLELDGDGRLAHKDEFFVDLRRDRQHFTTIVRERVAQPRGGGEGEGEGEGEGGTPEVIFEETRRETLSSLSTCVAPDRAQERVIVSADGAHLFHPAGRRLIRLTLPNLDGGAPRADALTCVVLAEVPGTPDVTGGDDEEQETSSGGDGALIIVPSDVAIDEAGNVLLADPGNGVVWRFDDDTSNQASTTRLGIFEELPADVDAFDVLVGDLVLEFAKLTDGHLGVGNTDACKPLNDDGVIIDDGRIDFDDFEFFVPFPDLHRLVLSDCNSSIAIIAGTGVAGFSGDGGLAVNARLSSPVAAVRGRDGDIYVADRDNDRIRRLIISDDPEAGGVRKAIITTFIGERDPNDTTSPTFAAPGAARTMSLDRPSGLAIDDTGALLIADASHTIRRVAMVTVDDGPLDARETAGDVTTIFGTGEPGNNGDELPATQTQLDEPSAIVFLPFRLLKDELPVVPPGGLLVVAERGGHRIRAMIHPPLLTPEVYTLAGTGEPGDVDDVGALARFVLPRGVMAASPTASTRSLGFFVVDAIDRVRTMDLAVDFDPATFALDFSTTIGTATASANGAGLPSRDDGEAALLRAPAAVTFLDADTAVFIDAGTGRLRTMTLSTSTVRTVAGMPAGTVVGPRATPAFTTEPLLDPVDIVFDADADVPTLWVSDVGAGALRRFTIVDAADPASWETSAVVVTGVPGPAGLAIDAATRTLFITDKTRHTVVELGLDEIPDDTGDAPVVVGSTTIAGRDGRRGAAGDAGPPSEALLNEPSGLAFQAPGARRLLFVADTANNRVRLVDLDAARITTVLGTGSASSGGTDLVADASPVDAPRGLAVDARGNLLVTSRNTVRLAGAGDRGFVDGSGGVTNIYGDAGRFPEPITRCLAGLALAPAAADTAPVVYAVDRCVGLLLRLERR